MRFVMRRVLWLPVRVPVVPVVVVWVAGGRGS
jgi:hypothetical protein